MVQMARIKKIDSNEVLKQFVSHHDIIEVITGDGFGVTTLAIAQKVNLTSKRVWDILKAFESAGIVKGKRDERNRLHWSLTRYTGSLLNNQFWSMKGLLEKPSMRADSERIRHFLNLVEKSDNIARFNGFLNLEKLTDNFYVSHEPRVIRSLTNVLADPSYDEFNKIIFRLLMKCMPYLLKTPEYSVKVMQEKIKKMKPTEIEGDLEGVLSFKEFEKFLKNFSVEKAISGLERYLEDPNMWVEGRPNIWVPQILFVMTWIDEEKAVENIIRLVAKADRIIEPETILRPSKNLSPIMQAKLMARLGRLQTIGGDEKVKQRASEVRRILDVAGLRETREAWEESLEWRVMPNINMVSVRKMQRKHKKRGMKP